MKTLHEIGLECGTDKATLHEYTRFYGELFDPIRHLPVSLLEQGVSGGESIKMWSQYFRNTQARIVGMDIEIHRSQSIQDPRVELILGSQTDEELARNMAGGFDVIIDDAGHFTDAQCTALNLWWPKLNPGGIWITEDIHAGYHSTWRGSSKPFTERMVEWIDRLNCHGVEHCGKPSSEDIDSITFRKSLMVIRKRGDGLKYNTEMVCGGVMQNY